MPRILMHPIVLFGGGVLVGYVFSSQVSKIPGVSRLPQK